MKKLLGTLPVLVLLLRDGRGWDLTAPRAELRTM